VPLAFCFFAAVGILIHISLKSTQPNVACKTGKRATQEKIAATRIERT